MSARETGRPFGRGDALSLPADALLGHGPAGRKRWVAAALSLAIPGLGHVYAGAFGVAVLLALLDRLVPAALELGAGLGHVSVKALAVSRVAVPVGLRLAAVGLAVSAVKRSSAQAAPVTYGLLTAGWVALAVALGQVLGVFVGAVTLTADAHGLRAGERVLVARFGEPRDGALAVFSTNGRVEVSTVTAVTPRADWAGEPLGVLMAPDWDRIGTAPSP